MEEELSCALKKFDTINRKVDDMGLGESEAHVMKSALTVCGKKYVCKDGS